MRELDPTTSFKSCASVVCLWQSLNQQISILGHQTSKLKHNFVQSLPWKGFVCSQKLCVIWFCGVFCTKNGMKTQLCVIITYEFVNIDQ